MPDDAPAADEESGGKPVTPSEPVAFPPYPHLPPPPPDQGSPPGPPHRPPPGCPPPPHPPLLGVASGHGDASPTGATTSVGPTDSLGRPVANWAKRAAAFVLDLVIAGVGGAIVAVVAVGNRITESTGGSTSIHLRPGDTFVLLALFFLTYTAYFTFLTGGRRGQTLGAMAVGVAVRDATGGGQIGAARALVRSMIISAFCIPYLSIPWALDMLTPLWIPGRQALHDKAVHSVVVDVR